MTDIQNIRIETFLDAFDGYGFYEYYEDYNYTYTHALEYLPLSEIIPVSVVLGIIGVSGFIGNILVIFAIAKVQRMRSITNLFLLSLASADLLLVIVCVPVKVCTSSYLITFSRFVMSVLYNKVILIQLNKKLYGKSRECHNQKTHTTSYIILTKCDKYMYPTHH